MSNERPAAVTTPESLGEILLKPAGISNLSIAPIVKLSTIPAGVIKETSMPSLPAADISVTPASINAWNLESK